DPPELSLRDVDLRRPIEVAHGFVHAGTGAFEIGRAGQGPVKFRPSESIERQSREVGTYNSSGGLHANASGPQIECYAALDRTLICLGAGKGQFQTATVAHDRKGSILKLKMRKKHMRRRYPQIEIGRASLPKLKWITIPLAIAPGGRRKAGKKWPERKPVCCQCTGENRSWVARLVCQGPFEFIPVEPQSQARKNRTLRRDNGIATGFKITERSGQRDSVSRLFQNRPQGLRCGANIAAELPFRHACKTTINRERERGCDDLQAQRGLLTSQQSDRACNPSCYGSGLSAYLGLPCNDRRRARFTPIHSHIDGVNPHIRRKVLADQARAAIDKSNGAKPRFIRGCCFGGCRRGVRGPPDHAVRRHRAAIEIDPHVRLPESGRRNLDPSREKCREPDVPFEIVRIDAKGTGRVGEANVVDTDMGLRQDNKDHVALRKRGKPSHAADLRSDLIAQSRIRKGPRRRGRCNRDKQGDADENEEYS